MYRPVVVYLAANNPPARFVRKHDNSTNNFLSKKQMQLERFYMSLDVSLKLFLRQQFKLLCAEKKIIGTSLPSIGDIACKRCLSKANSIIKDPTHLHHGLFTLLPPGKIYHSIRSRTARLCNSFFLRAIRLLNAM